MLSSLLNIIYLIASVTFIIGLKMLSNPVTARRGNLIAAFGMTLAIIATIFLYKDESGYNFMDNESFEQMVVQEALIDAPQFLKDGGEVSILINTETELPMTVELPDKIVMLVTYSEPGMKGDTATRTLKAATIETGATVMVPLFVNEGEMIRINTKTGDYVERVKE